MWASFEFYLYVMQDVKHRMSARCHARDQGMDSDGEKVLQYIQALLRCGLIPSTLEALYRPKPSRKCKIRLKYCRLWTFRKPSKLLAIVANLEGKMLLRFPKLIIWGTLFQFQKTFRCGIPIKPLHSLFKFSRKYWPWPKVAKKVVTYLSMGFGNPYGDPWSVEIVARWAERLIRYGVRTLSLSDTVGSSTAEVIAYLFSNLIPRYPNIEFGAHLHTTPSSWFEKVDAAFKGGCLRFDRAIQGFGGCPMAKDELTGNMPTEKMLNYFTTEK